MSNIAIVCGMYRSRTSLLMRILHNMKYIPYCVELFGDFNKYGFYEPPQRSFVRDLDSNNEINNLSIAEYIKNFSYFKEYYKEKLFDLQNHVNINKNCSIKSLLGLRKILLLDNIENINIIFSVRNNYISWYNSKLLTEKSYEKFIVKIDSMKKNEDKIVAIKSMAMNYYKYLTDINTIIVCLKYKLGIDMGYKSIFISYEDFDNDINLSILRIFNLLQVKYDFKIFSKIKNLYEKGYSNISEDLNYKFFNNNDCFKKL